ncbi:bifunctional metallophosphatase/5'-nucleotidase [Candidatus Skiveiella danica]|uniref:bifunctional metallophosphatase/5'-nucleotidase n=1 Tax=Candidatus Skiveiella danica TaxID=3386177 RepID=UPI001DD2FBE5|nr:5'-nucleotidase C-terminal domain-containing protein [Betaproteobacteria bacterium]
MKQSTLAFPTIQRLTTMAALVLGALFLGGCATEGAGPVQAPSNAPAAFELTIAHINDHHSQLDAFAATELVLDGVPTQVELGGFARQTSLFKSVAGTPNLLKLHAGDAMTGSLYYTFFKGKADARMMNTICFDAFIPGNHEFDDGDATLKAFLDELAQGPCQTPTLSANIVPQPGTPLAPAGGKPYLQPSIVKDIGGVRVGLVGITIAGKTRASSRPLASTQFLDETRSAQAAIDALTAQGVRHIVLMTHHGYEADLALAAQLTGVDVIIGGDSHTLLGDFKALGLPSGGRYPTVARNAAGERVCIGQAWEYGKAFGLMNVRFDAQGRVSQCSGQASLVIGEPFKRKDAAGAWQPLPAAEAAALQARLAANPAVRVLAPDPAAAQTLAGFASQVATEKARTIGTASEPLCLVRVPGERADPRAGAGCEAASSLARGSDVAQVVAEAFLRGSRRADFALQNAGGVRVPVPAGTLSMNTAFTVLPYTNVLVELDLTGAEVLAALEDGVANHLDLGQSNGSHPYAAGLRWDLDMSQPKGRRFSNVQVRSKTTGAWTTLGPAKTYVMVTNDFVAAGRDGYATLGPVYAAGRYVNTYLLYTQTFVDYLTATGPLARPSRADYSHQKVITRGGVALP